VKLFEARPQQILPSEQLRETLRAPRLGDDAVAKPFQCALTTVPSRLGVPQSTLRPLLLNDKQVYPGWVAARTTDTIVCLRVLAVQSVSKAVVDGPANMRRRLLPGGNPGWPSVAGPTEPVGQGGTARWLHGWFALNTEGAGGPR